MNPTACLARLCAPLLTLALATLSPGCAMDASGEKGGLVRVSPRQPLADVYQGRRFALLVGIDQFADASWRPLRYASKDALDLARALKAHPAFETTVLVGPTQTTRARILEELDRLQARADRPNDVVLVYFSSHGTLARDTVGELRRFLVTSDAQLRTAYSTALDVDALERRMDALASRRRVLILATCHSGGGKSLLPSEVARELATYKSAMLPPLEYSSRASIVLSASDWGEAAREDESLQNDVYTHFFVQALDGRADRNLDGAVTATEAHDYARQRTYAFTQGRQRPSAHILEVGADPVTLAGEVSRTGRPELFSYAPRLEGVSLKVDGAEAGTLPGGAVVEPGKRKVTLTKGGEVLIDRHLEVRGGERLALESLLDLGERRTAFAAATGLTFVDRTSRRELLPGALLFGVGARLERSLFESLDVWADAGVGQGNQTLNLRVGGRVPVRYRALSAGLGITHTWNFGPVGVSTGPRVAALWLQRSFSLDLFGGSDASFTVSPGWMGAVTWNLHGRLDLMLMGQALGSYVSVDGRGQVLGFTSLGVGAGYRF